MDVWSPPPQLFDSHWKYIYSACCLCQNDECEILETGDHFLDFVPNDTKLEILNEGIARLKGYLVEHGWPDDPTQVETALEWMEQYIENIEHFLQTGEYPQRQQIGIERGAAAGRKESRD